jgi:hypothetical protein
MQNKPSFFNDVNSIKFSREFVESLSKIFFDEIDKTD